MAAFLSDANKYEGVGLKTGRLFFLCSLVFVLTFVIWESDPIILAQSQTNGTDSPVKPSKDVPSQNDNDSSVIKTQKDQVNYAIGVNLIGNFKKQGVDIDLDMVIKGMRDAFSGDSLLLSNDELQKSLMVYQSEVRQTMAKNRSVMAENNRKEGEAFLAENQKKESVVTLPSGLQYRIIKSGEGRKPTETDSVTCHYRGTLVNGTEFDSSSRTGRPATFKVSGVIPGWQEALMRMPVGSIWQIFVPSQLAYGERGSAGLIGPNATLIFEIELLSIQ